MALRLPTILLLLGVKAISQPALQWKNCYGGSDGEDVYSMAVTKDHGLILAGFTASYDGQVSGWHGGTDMWVVKLDSIGNLEWQKALGGSKSEFAYGIIQDREGNYVLTGETTSEDGDVGENLGEEDMWVVKLDPYGNIIWKKILGGSGTDIGNAVFQAIDGGYIIAGNSDSSDGDISDNIGATDFWVLKLNGNGTLEWEKNYGGSLRDAANAIVATPDGGYVVGGQTWSEDVDVIGNHGNVDFWLIKIDSIGHLEWQKPMGGIGTETIRSIALTPNGGYAVVGETGSGNSGQVSGVHGSFEVWVVKLNAMGEMEWQKPFGGSTSDTGKGIVCTPEGELVIAATTTSKDGDAIGGSGEYQAWIFGASPAGDLEWQMPLGGTEFDKFNCVVQTPDGGFCFGGHTLSNDGDVSGNHGFQDVWVVKVAPDAVGTVDLPSDALKIYPNPAGDFIYFNAAVDGAARYEIRNMLGVVLKVGDLGGANGISVSELTGGVYTVSIVVNGTGAHAGRFVIQR